MTATILFCTSDNQLYILSRYSFSNLDFGPSLSGTSGSSVVGHFAACLGL